MPKRTDIHKILIIGSGPTSELEGWGFSPAVTGRKRKGL